MLGLQAPDMLPVREEGVIIEGAGVKGSFRHCPVMNQDRWRVVGKGDAGSGGTRYICSTLGGFIISIVSPSSGKLNMFIEAKSDFVGEIIGCGFCERIL